MNPETQQAIAERRDEILVSGYDLQDAIVLIKVQGGFAHTLNISSAGKSHYTIEIHWPETTAGELPLETQRQPARRSDEQTTDEDH